MGSRRDFIKQTSLFSAGLMMNRNGLFKNKDLGLQLYTVRSEVSQEKLASTIAQIAKAGYNQVELFGYNDRMYFGHTVKEMADILKQNNLKSPSGHYGLADMLYGDNYDWVSWKYLIEDAKTLKHKYITIPYLDEQHRTLDDFKRVADRLNKGGEMAKKAGMGVAYHNHNFEFAPLDGTTGYEVLLKNTDPRLVKMEMDIYWVRYADQDPLKLIDENPGRFAMWHMKDMILKPEKTTTVVGEGVIDFKKIYARRKKAGLEYVFVEQEQYTKPVFECIKESYDYIEKNIL